MSMREAICSTCGAINHADAPTCWRCLAEVRPTSATTETSQAGSPRSMTA
jgi:ribosomal protein L40E